MSFQFASTRISPRVLAETPHIHRVGTLDVRVARSEEEIAAAQALRYAIFYDEMGATPTPEMAATRRDTDVYDAVADHLLVIDHSDGKPHVVGTYRMLRQVVAAMNRGFYSAGEYDLTPLMLTSQTDGQLLELGRSCVAAEYRSNATITLLWRGIASYLQTHGIGFMFGCASLFGTDPDAHAAELSYLYHHHLAPPALRARALAHAFVPMDRLSPDAFDARAASRNLPPLIKGYIRVGAMVGDGAFIDTGFNTTDVFVVMPVERITRRYLDRFTGSANDPV